jgi:hypothetical protein
LIHEIETQIQIGEVPHEHERLLFEFNQAVRSQNELLKVGHVFEEQRVN